MPTYLRKFYMRELIDIKKEEQRTEAKKSVAKVAVNTAVQREKEKGNELYGGAASRRL